MSAAPAYEAVPSWQEKSLCSKVRVKDATTKDLKELCTHCPVISQCLEYALADPGRKGVWGGTSDYDRNKIRKARQEARSGTRSRNAAPASARSQTLALRNAQIREMVAKGADPADIAKQYKLSLRTIKRVLSMDRPQTGKTGA